MRILFAILIVLILPGCAVQAGEAVFTVTALKLPSGTVPIAAGKYQLALKSVSVMTGIYSGIEFRFRDAGKNEHNYVLTLHIPTTEKLAFVWGNQNPEIKSKTLPVTITHEDMKNLKDAFGRPMHAYFHLGKRQGDFPSKQLVFDTYQITLRRGMVKNGKVTMELEVSGQTNESLEAHLPGIYQLAGKILVENQEVSVMHVD